MSTKTIQPKTKNEFIELFMYESVNLEMPNNIKALNYNSNWSLLMPVVRRIMINEKFWDEGYIPYIEKLKYVMPYADIDEVYNAVTNFVTWWYLRRG